MQSILVRKYNLTRVAWDIEMRISMEEIIIMKDCKLFLSLNFSFSHMDLLDKSHALHKQEVCWFVLETFLNEAFLFIAWFVTLEPMLLPGTWGPEKKWMKPIYMVWYMVFSNPIMSAQKSPTAPTPLRALTWTHLGSICIDMLVLLVKLVREILAACKTDKTLLMSLMSLCDL